MGICRIRAGPREVVAVVACAGRGGDLRVLYQVEVPETMNWNGTETPLVNLPIANIDEELAITLGPSDRYIGLKLTRTMPRELLWSESGLETTTSVKLLLFSLFPVAINALYKCGIKSTVSPVLLQSGGK